MGGCIVDVVDEILSHNPNAAGVAANLHYYGSNGAKKADYSRGLLERFPRRAPNDWAPNGKGNAHVSTIANPRKIDYMSIPHFANYFEGCYAINENGGVVVGAFNLPVVTNKIVMNHYVTKSYEEYLKKLARGAADGNEAAYAKDIFDLLDRNEEFDEGILKYRAERMKTYRPPDKSHVEERLLNALMKNLSPTLVPITPPQFYAGKMETFLTCRAVAAYLQTRLTDATPAKFFEEAALKAILKSFGGMSFADARLFLRELPKLLKLPYPVVKDLRQVAVDIVPQMMNAMKTASLWREFIELDYLQDLLKLKEE